MVRVTKGIENSINEKFIVGRYNERYGTDFDDLTARQKQQFLDTEPSLMSWMSSGVIQVEVQEYLFDRTELYLPELTLDTHIYREHLNPYGWGLEGMEIVVFCQAPKEESQIYDAIEHWAYIISEDGYLVPVDPYYYRDILTYAGVHIDEYKEIVIDKKEDYDRKCAILPYCIEELSVREWAHSLDGNVVFLQEKQNDDILEIYALVGLGKTWEGELINLEGGLVYFELQRGIHGYEVINSYWNWEGQETGEFPDEILELAAEHGFQDGSYLDKMADTERRKEWLDLIGNLDRDYSQWKDYWIYEEVMPKMDLPKGDKNRLIRLELLLPEYFKYYGDPDREIVYAADDLEYADSYEHLISNFDHDICAIVEVTDGTEDTIEQLFYLKAYNEYFGTDYTELTASQIQAIALAQPKTMELVSRDKMDVKVQEYLYDKTGLKLEELTIDAPVDREKGRWKVATGMKLILFIDAPDDASAVYDSSVAWAYYITEDDYLVPLTISYHEDMLDYGGMELKQYQRLIQKGYAKYKEPASVRKEREERWAQWGQYWDGTGVWYGYQELINAELDKWLKVEETDYSVKVETVYENTWEEDGYHVSLNEADSLCKVYEPESDEWRVNDLSNSQKRKLINQIRRAWVKGSVEKVDETLYEWIIDEDERIRYYFTEDGELEKILFWERDKKHGESVETRVFIQSVIR